MAESSEIKRDTSAWIFQVWASFIVAVCSMLLGIYHLPVDRWVRGFMALSSLFAVASSFTLAKTLRDNHEATRMLSRLTEAKAEKLIREFELSDELSNRAVAKR